ncbi:TPA: efflux transporter periplasmic adaptor subunit, partial [Stenotrophomonas maltophilia]|nr:efflux transporter periplasmic adaptor subunit [Stenotrophomonas maltophilia]
WLVRHGLKAGEKVVVEGQERLQEGVVVDARDWQLPVASASTGAAQAGSKG